MAGWGKLNEVKYEWTIDDLFDAHDLLDMKEEAEQRAAEKARRG